MRAVAPALLLAACTANPSRSATAPAPPDDVAWVLAIAEGEDVTASALVPREDLDDVGAVLPEGWASGERVWILGFTQAELDAIPWTPSEEAARAAGANDFLLPTPSWRVSGAIDGGAATLAADEGHPPDVTVAGLPACPDVYGDDAFADVRCRGKACVAAIEQRGCAFSVDFTGCEIDVRGTLDGRGAPVFAADSECEVSADRDGPRSVVECPDLSNTTCQVHLYDGLEPLVAPVQTATVYDVEPAYIELDTFEDLGYLGGLAVLDDRVVVLGFGGRQNQIPCTGLSAELTFLTREDLAPIRTSTTVTCLRDIVASHDRTTFFGVAAENPSTRFIEFDRDGVVLREVERASPAPNRAPEYRRIVVHGDGAYASFIEFHVGTRTEHIVTVDLERFTMSGTVVSDDDAVRPYDLIGLDARDVLIADRELNRVVQFDVVRGEETSEFQVCDPAVHPEAVFADATAVYALATGDDTSLSVLELASGGANCVVAKPFVAQLDARQPVGFVGDELVVTARTLDLTDETEPGRAVVTTYRREREAFRPGLLDIGFGVPRHARLVDGALYATLPWSGHVVRVLLTD